MVSKEVVVVGQGGLFRTVALLVGAGGALSGATYGMLTQQGRRTREALRIPGWAPYRADGVYQPNGDWPVPPAPHDPAVDTFALAVLGDSAAAGLGVDRPDQLPGVQLARGLAEELGRPVRLVTHAVVGTTTPDLSGQLDAALADPPDAVLIIVGVNDVTKGVSLPLSARLLGEAVGRLREAGVVVVVGTCPDLGTVSAIPQPLRGLAHIWTGLLARMQRDAVLRAGGYPVALADLLEPEFFSQPDALFSRDRYHPSAHGYDAACAVLLPAFCSALGVWGRPPTLRRHRRRRTGWPTQALDRGLRRLIGQPQAARL